MMDYFFIFEYSLASSTFQQAQRPPLKYLKYTKINVNLTEQQQYKKQFNAQIFDKINEDITQSKILFKKMVQRIINDIGQLNANFTNVSLICKDITLFTQVLPRQCTKRGLAMPYLLMNYMDLREFLRIQCYCPYKKWTDIVQYMEVCTAKETQIKSFTQISEKILKKLHKDNKLISTSQKYIKRCQKITHQIMNQFQSKFKYYKIIGLPFKAFPQEILNTLAHQVPQSKRDIIFLYERQRFSGRAIIKIPQNYQKELIAKNRMYIGSRYIEIQLSTQHDFQKAKIRSEYKSDTKSSDRHKQGYSRQKNQYRPSHSPQYRSRSRQKHFSKNEQASVTRRRDQNPFQNDFNLNAGQYGIKIRGLPFSFSQWDVQNIFNFYNIIGGSVKMGIKPGTKNLKNGQAVLLMRGYNDAQKSLDMNGFNCMGRYLDVRIIGKEQYTKYK